MNLPVTDNGVRPNGHPDLCFYCGFEKGTHKEDCVCPQKSVVIKMTIEYVVSVPRFWEANDIDFHRNDSSWCAGNAIAELNVIYATQDCLCEQTTFEFVREATEEDHEKLGIADEESLVKMAKTKEEESNG